LTRELIEQVSEHPDIYKINVPLPDNPLKNLNCYVIKTPAKNLIIDTGFNLPESKQALLEGLVSLEINMDRTEIFATHLHADHVGLIGTIMQEGTVTYMSPIDYEILTAKAWNKYEVRMAEEGFPIDEILLNRTVNPAHVLLGKPFVSRAVRDGDQIAVGSYIFTVIDVPGHTPGNTCLYMAEEKILFTGDHILFDITPNIAAWPGTSDSLGNYLESLHKIRKLDIRLALPAHRQNSIDVYERIRQIFTHHENRLENTLNVLRAHPNSSAYKIASQMEWSLRVKNWDEAPVYQKWFATGETCAHLDHLVSLSKVTKRWANQVYQYQITE
jgi:glyoxylase-like metal-dependent hydrolase (beta-lactamase superfamily II)